jgi:spermidine synthase
MSSLKKTPFYLFTLFILGFIAMSVQIITIREALAMFNSNELVIGLCLGLWMILTAAGAFFGSLLKYPENKRQHRLFWILFIFLVLCILPFFMPWELAYLKSHLLPAGVMAGIGHIFMILLFVIAPFCLLSGLLFPVLTARLSHQKSKNLSHQAYAMDSTGSILGGILFSILIFNTQHSTFNIQHSIDIMLFPGQEVIESKQTPYGKITITRIAEQYNLFENSNPVPLAGDATQREEAVHYAMLLHPQPEQVLMISCGIGGTIDEVFKYSGVQVDYLETNSWLIKMADKYVPFARHDHLKIITKDPRIYLNNDDKKYDVILINTPDPNSAEINRFYTLEFFKLLKARLNPGGIVSLSIPAAGNYMNESARMLHSVIYNTLAREFRDIRIIPGNRDFYLASDGTLNKSLWVNLMKDSIPTLYVNPGYIDEAQMNARSALIMNEIDSSARINTDLRPYVYLQAYRQWLDQFKTDHRILPAILIVLTILAFILLKPVSLGLFTAGFTTASLEFILIIWFQAMYGMVYQVTGLIFAAFMAGMAAGSFSIPRFCKTITSKEFLKMQSVFIILPVIIASVMLIIPYSLESWLKILIIFIFVMATGSGMGSLFALSGFLQKTTVIKSSGQAFSADLVGSAIGILLASTYLVPVMGLPVTVILVSLLNLAAILISKVKNPSK